MKKKDFLNLIESYDSVIFDFGGIFINIDPLKTAKQLAIFSSYKDDYLKHYHHAKNHVLFKQFEIGEISDEEFISELKALFKLNCNDQQVINAWNQMLLDIPVARKELLEEIKKEKKVFLLSNTNSIHEKYFKKYTESTEELKVFFNLFDKCYLSHHLALRKPDPKIFQHVIDENQLDPSKTLFIDDTIEHINSAQTLGLQAYLLEQNSLTN